MPPLLEPPYDFSEVPRCKRDLSGSVIVRVNMRWQWLSYLSEMLLLANEAASRRCCAHVGIQMNLLSPRDVIATISLCCAGRQVRKPSHRREGNP